MSDAPEGTPMTIADLMKNKASMIEQLQEKMNTNPEKMHDPTPVDMDAAFEAFKTKKSTNVEQEPIKAPADLPMGTQTARVCPCCGWMVNEFWHPNFTDNLKLDFQEKVILQGERWTQIYPLFGGNMILELRTLTGMEQRISMDLALNLSNPPRLLDIFRYELACAVASITRGKKQDTYDEIDKLDDPRPYKEVYDRITDRVDKVISRWTVPLYGVIQRQYNKFEITHTQMTSKASDMDFWPATL